MQRDFGEIELDAARFGDEVARFGENGEVGQP